MPGAGKLHEQTRPDNPQPSRPSRSAPELGHPDVQGPGSQLQNVVERVRGEAYAALRSLAGPCSSSPCIARLRWGTKPAALIGQQHSPHSRPEGGREGGLMLGRPARASGGQGQQVPAAAGAKGGE